ncbi:MAG: ATP synthase F1 subunit gamma [Clostridia bacterium]|nr:ATP synthase F1 subunit gamma [Clostridia bacterium]
MAGASMKDIKLRIKSVESTMQITKAMQLVATSKLRRAKERMEASKPFTTIAQEAISAVAARCDDPSVPFIAPRPVKRRCYIVIAGDRGLAGGYNSNVFKAVAAHAEGLDYCVLPMGRKAVERYHRYGVESLTDEYVRVEGLSVGASRKLADILINGYLTEKYDELWIVYTSFLNMMTQEVQVDRLLPVEKAAEDPDRPPVDTIYELEPAETLMKVMPDFISGRLYSALCDSFASEVSARRTAMDSATKNAGEMISDLRLKFNRARQGAITQEITEIVAGAEQ